MKTYRESRLEKLALIISQIPKDKNGCMMWPRAINTCGYGIFTLKTKMCRVHRLVYGIYNPNFDEALFIKHTCKNKSCCNIDHLEAHDNI